MQTPRPLFRLSIVLLVLLVAVALRVYRLESDLPFNLSPNLGESIDWTWYLQPSFEAIGVANADPSLTAYRETLLTAYQTAFLKVFQPPIERLGILSLLPGLLLLAALEAACRRAGYSSPERWAIFILGAVCFYLVMFSRLPGPYLWTALGGLLAAWIWPRQPLWAIALVIIFALGFKFVSLLFIFILLAAHASSLSTQRKDLKRAALALVGVLVLGIVAFILIPQLRELAAEVRGKLHYYTIGVASFDNLDLQLRLYIRELRQTILPSTLGLGIAAYVGFFLVLLALTQTSRRSLKFFDIYCGLIFGTSLVMLWGLRYRPIRHFLILLPVAIVLAVRVPALWKAIEWKKMKASWLTLVASLMFWLPVYRVSQWLLPVEFWRQRNLSTAWLWLGVTLVSFLLAMVFARNTRQLEALPALNKYNSRRLFAIYCGLLALTQLWAYFDWAKKPQYSVQAARAEFEKIVPRDAVVIGTYAHLLTMNTGRLAFKLRDPRVIDIPTHMAIDAAINIPANQTQGVDFNKYELLQSLPIRGYEVRIYRLPRE